MGSKDVVYTSREIDLKTCNFSKPELVGEVRKSYMTLNNHRGIIIQTPKLTLRNMTENVVELLVSRNRDRNREFYHILSHLEDIAITTIAQNSKEWFEKTITKEQIELMFRSSIQCPLKIDDSFIIKIIKAKELNIEPNYQVVCLLKIDGILFGRSSSKLDMKIIHAKFVKSDFSSNGSVSKNIENIPYFNDGMSVSQSIYSNNITKERVIANERESLKEQVEKEQVEKEQVEKERIMKERVEKEQVEKERIMKEHMEKEQVEKEQMEKEQVENERVENELAEKVAKELADKKIEEQEQEKERHMKERVAKKRAEKERIREQAEKERIREQAEKELAEKELAEKELAELANKELVEKERIMKERIMKEIAEDRADKELIAKELIAKELIAKELIAKELIAKELIAKELIAKELIAKELITKELIAKELIAKELIAKELKAKELDEDSIKCNIMTASIKNDLDYIQKNKSYVENILTEDYKESAESSELDDDDLELE
jgi:hypothetical protein